LHIVHAYYILKRNVSDDSASIYYSIGRNWRQLGLGQLGFLVYRFCLGRSVIRSGLPHEPAEAPVAIARGCACSVAMSVTGCKLLF